ncbi:hypothetical protein GBF38_012573 [Nibea albiflora]|uniref:Uncharacterized protein n=1 Tax=Nibea albiflora TaxID=240163 RepID=A0ACB7EK65_NIBAL|nr:hypothetical protein GBF38_012573 [Nibea albiflora]
MANDKEQPVTAGEVRMEIVREQRAITCPKADPKLDSCPPSQPVFCQSQRPGAALLCPVSGWTSALSASSPPDSTDRATSIFCP